MAVPKRKSSRSRKGMRKAHDALDLPPVSIDRKTKSVHRPHHVDLRTGFYGGKQVLFKDEDQGGESGSDKA
ncbi:MAG TPA: 50S ribosomal protein L32 [Planctomycetota bacterium]|nr:50S ribosomal protein L32 [Planctomycetota bacterium]